MLFTAQFREGGSYSMVFAVNSEGEALAADDDGVLSWHSLEGARVGAFYLDPTQAAWWNAIRASDNRQQQEEPKPRNSRRALRG